MLWILYINTFWVSCVVCFSVVQRAEKIRSCYLAKALKSEAAEMFFFLFFLMSLSCLAILLSTKPQYFFWTSITNSVLGSSKKRKKETAAPWVWNTRFGFPHCSRDNVNRKKRCSIIPSPPYLYSWSGTFDWMVQFFTRSWWQSYKNQWTMTLISLLCCCQHERCIK